jgi:hypothetical protein
MYSGEGIILPTLRSEADPVHYELDFEGHRYAIFYERGFLRVERENEQVFLQQLSLVEESCWNDAEHVVYTFNVTQAIREGRLGTLKLPTKDEVDLAFRLPWTVRSTEPIHLEAQYQGRHYAIFYECGSVRIERERVRVFLQRLSGHNDNRWSDKERDVYLSLINKAVDQQSFDGLTLPTKDELE